MSVQQKVGILGNRPSSAYTKASPPQQHVPVEDVTAASPGRQEGRDPAALQLWNKWAVQALGHMSSEPTPEQLASKSKRVKQLEQECAALAAQAQRRLEASAMLRSSPVTAAPGSPGQRSVAGPTGTFNREMQYSAREQHKLSAYAAARMKGTAEAAAAPSAASPVLKSRAMLDAMISGGALHKAAGQAMTVPASPGLSRIRPQSASGGFAGTRGSVSGSQRHAPASPGTFKRSGSVSQVGHESGLDSPRHRNAAQCDPDEFADMQAEIKALGEHLQSTQAAMEAQQDMEGQLRETIEVLRARVHSMGKREVEAQRRLAQHTKLEPLFDQLAEVFTFSSPDEVVARLEFLEDDKLGTFDQLLRAQEEVTKLQQRLAASQHHADTVATTLTTQHLQGSAALQAQNEQLKQELEGTQTHLSRLTARQAQLVALQTAVLGLWGKCMDDPAFSAASSSAASSSIVSSAGKQGAGAAASVKSAVTDQEIQDMGSVDDPVAMLSMIQEYVAAKSPGLSMRNYLDIQRVANRVWQHHFKTKNELRGKVVQTFDQLSSLADTMASRVKVSTDAATRANSNEKELLKQLKRLSLEKRQLQQELEKRDDMVRSLLGVPRSERPASTMATLQSVARTSASPSRASSVNRSSEPCSPVILNRAIHSSLSQHTTPRSPSFLHSASGAAGMAGTPRSIGNTVGSGSSSHRGIPPRPGSAQPASLSASGKVQSVTTAAKRPMSARAPGASPSGYAHLVAEKAGGIAANAAAAAAAIASSISDRPRGDHWAIYTGASGGDVGVTPPPGGAIFHAVSCQAQIPMSHASFLVSPRAHYSANQGSMAVASGCSTRSELPTGMHSSATHTHFAPSYNALAAGHASQAHSARHHGKAPQPIALYAESPVVPQISPAEVVFGTGLSLSPRSTPAKAQDHAGATPSERWSQGPQAAMESAFMNRLCRG